MLWASVHARSVLHGKTFMGKEKGKQSSARDSESEAVRTDRPMGTDLDPDEDGSGRIPTIPDLIRRAMAVGFSSFFTTEEAIRKALGDTLPQDWVEFVSAQSERSRKEFIDRLAQEFVRAVEKIDIYALAERLLEGRTIDVSAQIRLGKRRGEEAAPAKHKAKGKRG